MAATEKEDLEVIGMGDVPQFKDIVKYYDGDLAFADDISSFADLAKVVKINFVAFAFCLKGHVSVNINGTTVEADPHDVVFMRMNSVVTDIEPTADFECKILVVSAQLGLTFTSKSIFDALLKLQSLPVMHFTSEETELMSKYYDLALFKIKHPNLNYGRETMVSILRNLSLDLLAGINKHIDEGDDNAMVRQSDKIFHRFISLLTTNEGHERSVKWFAQQLCISPKYLTSICGQKTGKTASELIAANITERIRQRLQFSDKSIKEIASEMNFDNLSFFGKYVKKHLGMSPNHFRRINHYGM